MLRYFLAVLNSTVIYWQMINLSHKYARGYLMLEKKTLARLKVPDPEHVPAGTMKRIQQLVNERLSGDESKEVEIDLLVAQLYGLSRSEMEELGLAQ